MAFELQSERYGIHAWSEPMEWTTGRPRRTVLRVAAKTLKTPTAWVGISYQALTSSDSELRILRRMSLDIKGPKGSSVAKQRWKLLGKALVNKTFNSVNGITSMNVTNDVSVRRFSSYGLLTTRKIPPSLSSSTSDSTDDCTWFHCSSPSHKDFSISVRYLKQQFSPEELIGFNNTGNVCVWPSEEVLAHYCLTNRDLFREKMVCELGGGMTCLAGVAVACVSNATRVILTDGNDLSCKNIEVIVEKNRDRFGETEVFVRNLRWNEQSSFCDLKECIDVILCADCLFFDQYRSYLVDAIHSLLSPNGIAVIFAPCRNHTLQKFCQQAQSHFNISLEDNYDPLVWNMYQKAKSQGKDVFDEDIHYPLKITLTKRHHSQVCSMNGSEGHSEVNHQNSANGFSSVSCLHEDKC